MNSPTISPNLILSKDIVNNTVELASLIWQYLSPKKYREFLSWDYILLSQIEKAIKSASEEIFLEIWWEKRAYKKEELQKILTKTKERIKNKKSDFRSFIKTRNSEDFQKLSPKVEKKELSWKDFLGENCPQNEKSRIQELYNIPEVKDFLTRELYDRKDNFDLLHEWNERLNELIACDDLINKWKEKILSIKADAWRSHEKITIMDQGIIQRITQWIEQEQQKKNILLQERPLATAYRNYTLRTYKKQLDTSWFVLTPSRQKIVDHIVELVLTGNHVILVWPTWTGKTALGIQAIKLITKNLWKEAYFAEISGSSLAQETGTSGKQEDSIQILDNFIHVLSGHAGITPSEFISKTKLRPDWKWWTETHTELGKILKAFVEWSIPLIDEIDLIPNEILMRIKHLFSLRTKDPYSPQEDWNQKYILLSNIIIATANIKGKKHPGREDIDPAILRLLRWVNVSYLPKEELYDLAIVSLMESEWYINWVSKESLSDETSFLWTLIQAVKEIEENYLGNWTGETTSAWSQNFLKKTLLETGRFLKFFAGYHGSWIYLHDFIKKNLLDMVCDYSLPKQDRLIIMKILWTKWIIVKSDIENILNNSFDYTKQELESNIVSEDFEFSSGWVDFLDNYEVANLDPYKKRSLSSLWESEDKKLIWFFQWLSQYLDNNGIDQIDRWEELQELLDTLLNQQHSEWQITLSNRQKKTVFLIVSWLLLEDSSIQSYVDSISSIRQERSEYL
jgi:hypothetical protein